MLNHSDRLAGSVPTGHCIVLASVGDEKQVDTNVCFVSSLSIGTLQRDVERSPLLSRTLEPWLWRLVGSRFDGTRLVGDTLLGKMLPQPRTKI